MGAFRYLFSLHGRINRAKLWLFVPIWLGVDVVTLALCPPANETTAVSRLLSVFLYVPPAGSPVIAWAGTAVDILLEWIGIVLTVKRLHDRDKGAWWLILMWFVPNLSSAISLYQFGFFGERHAPLPELSAWQHLAAIFLGMISLWAFIELYCRRGSIGDNRFGPDPRARPAIPAGTVMPVDDPVPPLA